MYKYQVYLAPLCDGANVAELQVSADSAMLAALQAMHNHYKTDAVKVCTAYGANVYCVQTMDFVAGYVIRTDGNGQAESIE